MSRKIFLALALSLGMIECKTEEPKKPQLESVTLSKKSKIIKKRKNFKKELEQLIQEHQLPYFEGVYIYTSEQKQDLFDALKEKYNYTDEEISIYQEIFDARQNLYGATALLPRDRIGIGERSLLCVLPGLSKYVFTTDDLKSEIIDYAGQRAKDNAEGLILAGTKIGLDEINQMGPLVYQDILDLRARTYQICEIARTNLPVSPKFREALYMKYLRIGMNLAVTITQLEQLKKQAEYPGKEFKQQQTYAFLKDAVEQAKKMMEGRK